MTPQEAADVVKAYYKDEAQIQVKKGYGWNDTNHPVFDSFESIDYRVKPTPKVIWVNEYTNGTKGLHLTQQEAIDHCSPSGTTTKYQEIL